MPAFFQTIWRLRWRGGGERGGCTYRIGQVVVEFGERLFPPRFGNGEAVFGGFAVAHPFVSARRVQDGRVEGKLFFL